MRVALVAAIACSAPPAPPSNHVAGGGAPPVSACPVFISQEGGARSALLHDVFPGCGPMPFPYEFAICRGDCPHMCRETTHGVLDVVLRNDYDADGNWVDWRVVSGKSEMTSVSCTRHGGRLATCSTHFASRSEDVTTIDRDLAGRPIALREPSSTATFRYAGSDIVEAQLDGQTITLGYDANHRLVREDDIKYDYDAAGRLAHRTTGDRVTAYRYDTAGHLIAVDEPPPGATWQFDYDDAGRPIHAHGKLGDGEEWNTRYEYDCR